jgi:hypothetical protein
MLWYIKQVSHLDSAKGGATEYSTVLSAGAVTHKAVPVQRTIHCARVQQLILLVHVEAGDWLLKLRRRKLRYKEIKRGVCRLSQPPVVVQSSLNC